MFCKAQQERDNQRINLLAHIMSISNMYSAMKICPCREANRDSSIRAPLHADSGTIISTIGSSEARVGWLVGSTTNLKP